MASVADIPKAIRRFGLFGMFKKLWREIGEDELFTAAAALSYSWLFALFPFILFLITLIPLIPEEYREGARHQLLVQIYDNLPKEAADTIWVNIRGRVDELLRQSATALPIIGLILTLWAASGGVAATMAAIDKCYDVQKPRPIYKQRPLAMGLTIILVILVLLVLLLVPIGSLVTRWATDRIAERGWQDFLPLLVFWQFARYAIGVLLMLAILALLYHFGPNIRGRRFRFFSPGAIFVVAMWLLLGFAFKFYIEKFGKYNETYGTVGGVVILLLLFYLDALVLLIGAEINAELDEAVVGKPVGIAEAEADGIALKSDAVEKLERQAREDHKQQIDEAGTRDRKS
jgi:membrane protein